jgi:hypothetical protein
MAELAYMERLNFEDLFGMRSGYVLDFSDRTFQEFVLSVTGLDVQDNKYNLNSGSKANRLRAFIKQESSYIVGSLLEELVNYSMREYKQIDNDTFELYEACMRSAKNLKEAGCVEHIDAIQPNNNDKDFQLLSKSIRDSIDKNEPEVALDRLHTFVIKYIRELCNKYRINFDKSESLNAVFGKYVKYLADNKLVDSLMSVKILKYSISIIEAFNEIRNNKSLAHDNPILNYEESILIFNNLTNLIKFIQALEMKNELKTAEVYNT